MVYYAWFDKETDRIMASGRNTTSLQEAVNEMIKYLSAENHYEKEDTNIVKKMSLFEKVRFIEGFNFKLKKSIKKFKGD